MHKQFLKGARRWIGASALALAVAVPGLIGYSALSNQSLAQAQASVATTNVAQISVAPGAPSSFADLVDAVKPAVVSVYVEIPQTQQGSRYSQDYYFNYPDLPQGDFFRRFFEQFGPNAPEGPNGPNSPRQMPRHVSGAGSGFIISADGYVVTNNHVVDSADKITVVMDDGEEHEARLIGTDARTDLALLKIDGKTDLPFVTFADKEARVGDWIIAIGNPFGNYGGSVTAGIVSARNRDLSDSATGDFLQLDAAINRGNSGGPAFNLEGQVIGVNTAIASPNGGNVGIAFAIPASIVKQIVADLQETGSVTRGFLGVTPQDVTRDIANSVGLPNARGAMIASLIADTPAAKAGLQSGDIIIEVDGQAIDNATALVRIIGSKAPEDSVNIVVWRDGAEKSFTVTLAKLDENQPVEPQAPTPPSDIAGPVQSSVGLSVVPNADGQGLVIETIDPNSIAAEKDLQPGDVILEANYQPVSSPDDFEKAIGTVRDKKSDTVLLKLSRNGNIRFVGLPLSDK